MARPVGRLRHVLVASPSAAPVGPFGDQLDAVCIDYLPEKIGDTPGWDDSCAEAAPLHVTRAVERRNAIYAVTFIEEINRNSLQSSSLLVEA